MTDTGTSKSSLPDDLCEASGRLATSGNGQAGISEVLKRIGNEIKSDIPSDYDVLTAGRSRAIDQVERSNESIFEALGCAIDGLDQMITAPSSELAVETLRRIDLAIGTFATHDDIERKQPRAPQPVKIKNLKTAAAVFSVIAAIIIGASLPLYAVYVKGADLPHPVPPYKTYDRLPS